MNNESIIIILIFCITLIFPSMALAEKDIPDWLKTTVLWWGQGKVSDDEFMNLIEYLLKHEIIDLPDSYQGIRSQSQSNISSNLYDDEPQMKFKITNSNYKEVFSDPMKYVGYNIELEGLIINTEKFISSHGYMLDIQDNQYSLVSRLAYFTIDKSENPSIKERYCYNVNGTIVGEDKIHDPRSEIPVTVPLLQLDNYTTISCVNFFDPSLKTVIVNEIEHDGSMKVMLDRIEFTTDHTRLYVEIENTRRFGELIINSRDTKIIQGDTEINSESILYSRTEQLFNDKIKTDEIVNGYIFLEPVPFDELFEKPFSVMIVSFDNEYYEHKVDFYVKP